LILVDDEEGPKGIQRRGLHEAVERRVMSLVIYGGL
jgi:hypothetical protein